VAFAGEGYWRNAFVVFLCLEGLTAKVVDVVEDQTVLLSLAFDTKIMDLKSNFFVWWHSANAVDADETQTLHERPVLRYTTVCFHGKRNSFGAFVSSSTYLLTYLLTPWSRVLPEKLKRPELLKKFPAFYGTRRFITAFTRARHLSLS
jgi:hypothetical protein